MKKIEREWFKAGIIVTMLFVFGVIVIFSIIKIVINEEPEFKITKEVCENKSHTKSILELSEGELFKEMAINNIHTCFKKGIVTATSGLYKDWDFYFCDYGYEDKEVCEQVEVDEIIFPDNPPFPSEELQGFICIDPPKLSLNEEDTLRIEGCTYYVNDKYVGEGKLQPLRGVSKQDLTEKWLEENCKFVHQTTNKGNWDIPIIYQCEDYLVEVVK